MQTLRQNRWKKRGFNKSIHTLQIIRQEKQEQGKRFRIRQAGTGNRMAGM